MKLSELITAYGDERIEMQNLDHCSISLDMDKKGTKITFGTSVRLNLDGPEKLGLIIWLDRDEVARITSTKEKVDG